VEEAVGFVGPTDRAEPVEMALSAIAACLANSIALNAPRHGIPLEGLEIKVSCDIDPSVLFEVKGPESHTSCMPKVTTEVTAKGDRRFTACWSMPTRWSPRSGVREARP